MSDNHYEVLGVQPDATRDQIREAHRARVAALEAAREKKGVSESQLQANREETARVRAAWNVLSDPFQRRRYDAGLEADVTAGGEGEGEAPGTEVVPAARGWRRSHARPKNHAPTTSRNVPMATMIWNG